MDKGYQLLNEIKTLNSNQRGDFWKLIKTIRKNETVEESSDASSEDWIKHFKNLLHWRNSRIAHKRQFWQNNDSVKWDFKCTYHRETNLWTDI